MKTDTIFAYQVENNDHVVLDDEVKGYVYSISEDDDYIILDVVDDEDEHTEYPFGPFQSVNIVVSFDDDIEIPEGYEVD